MLRRVVLARDSRLAALIISRHGLCPECCGVGRGVTEYFCTEAFAELRGRLRS